jgi:phage terminase large subunit
MTAIRAYIWDMAGKEGVIFCGRQFYNSLDDSSLEEIKGAIRSEPWLAQHFDIGEKYIKTNSGRIRYIFGGLDRSIESIKSKARILLGWVDEAEPVTEDGWTTLIPTLRDEESELWVTWNPKRKTAPSEARFRNSTDPRYKVVELNYKDNPWFPTKLERDRLRDLKERPEMYPHIWDGAYATAVSGSYYAQSLIKAKDSGRIGKVSADPLIQVRAFWDIGYNDSTAIWVAQFVGRGEIRLLDYYEAKEQPLATHLLWLRTRWPDSLQILPHDGANHSNITGMRFSDHIREAGFKAETVGNQGRGADMLRIEAARRLFPSMWFNEETCHYGITALGYYHEKKHSTTGVGLGPSHDEYSHCADAFGLMAVAYEAPREKTKPRERAAVGGGSWMA